jgi:hypothetical protein
VATPRSKHHRNRAQWTALVAGAATAIVCLALTAGAIEFAGLQEAPAAIAQASSEPHEGGFYLAHDRSGHVDHHVLFHGADPESTRRLKAAEVIFLGNSRLMFALERPSLRLFFGRHGVEYYVLGFGHNEHDHFPKAIIRRFDLRPRLVVVNADRFFVGDQSAWADRVVEDSWFDAQKFWFEAEASHAVRRWLHRWVPHVPTLEDSAREFIAYRSRLDGTWHVASQPEGRGSPMRGSDRTPPAPDPGRLARARAFKQEVEERGGRLVLCLVPSPRASRGTAEWLARELDVPLIAPEPENLRTHDGSHLTPESAARFAHAFLAELEPLIADIARRAKAGS